MIAPDADSPRPPRSNEMTPADVLDDLRAGNERFASGHNTQHEWLEQARQTAEGQHPKAFIFGCVDSRVPAEVVFDKGIGDVFVGRIAGHVLCDEVLGSMEFATEVTGAKVIVVLGHTECGAVKGALEGAPQDPGLGHLAGLLAGIRPAIRDAGAVPASPPIERKVVDRVTEVNVQRTVEAITDRSVVLHNRVEQGKLLVAGGIYDVATGRVRWLD